ncbi:MAG TPA: DUF120 domain-containing protein [Pyrinomonadaceae bacterium]|jgi:riboflavin kinase
MKVLRGKVFSGVGNFSYWIEKLQDDYLAKTGMRFFPGTLNLQLAESYGVPADALRLDKEDYGGTVTIYIVPCTIFGRKAFILRPESNEKGFGTHARSVIEVACDVKLRELYNLEDGDVVQVEVAE